MDERKVKSSLKKLVAIFMVVCIIATGISQYMYRSANSLYKQSVYSRLEERAIQYQKSFIFKLESDLKTLRAMAGMIEDSPFEDAEKLVLGLRQANEASDFVRLSYFKEDGTGFRLISKDKGIEHITTGELEKELQTAVKKAFQGTSYCSETYYDPVLGYNVLSYVIPVYKNEQICGVLASTVSTNVYVEIFSSIQTVSGEGDAGVIRADGSVLASTRDHPVKGFYNLFESTYLSDDIKEKFKIAFSSDDAEFFKFELKNKCYYACVLQMGVFTAKLVIVDTDRGVSESVMRVTRNAQILGILFFISLMCFAFFVFWSGRRYSAKLIKIAYHDKLTGAYNKEKFLQLLNDKLQKKSKCTVIALNIRKFKFINEMLGISKSNLLLNYVCDVIKNNIYCDEFFGRDTADSFFICLRDLDENDLKKRLDIIFKQINQLAMTIHPNCPIYFYCGCAAASGNQSETLISRVMLALSYAKKEQRNYISFYDINMYEKEKMKNFIENNMEKALRNGEFHMFLQPKFSLSEGKLSGAEALVRWITDGEKMIYPDQFIPIFEKNGFCIQLDFYMVEQACKQIRQWLDEGLPAIPISVNQTKLLFYEEGYVERLYEITRRYNVSPKYITLEILEGLALDNVNQLNECITKLRKYGFHISMDDFGTGYSSLNVLGDLSIDELKLDRGFLMQAKENKDSNHRKILQMVIKMAKIMNITTVAEGVETADSEQMLKELSCDYGQGYYYSKPLSVDEFREKFIDKL